jgi:UPF0716 protein FxsA
MARYVAPVVVILLLIAVPVAELYVFIQVQDAIGFVRSLLALVAISIVGGLLVRWQGVGVLFRVRTAVGGGHGPTRELMDGFVLLLAGLLLLTPGFVTDAFGLVLLIPPVRKVVRSMSLRRLGFAPTQATHNGPIDR